MSPTLQLSFTLGYNSLSQTLVYRGNYATVCTALIIVPFVEQMREFLEEDKAAVVIMDNFKGQVTKRMTKLMDSHNIHTYLIPPNTTDRLQPMDVAVNKPAKAFLKQKFQIWYAEQISVQLEDLLLEHPLFPLSLKLFHPAVFLKFVCYAAILAKQY